MTQTATSERRNATQVFLERIAIDSADDPALRAMVAEGATEAEFSAVFKERIGDLGERILERDRQLLRMILPRRRKGFPESIPEARSRSIRRALADRTHATINRR